MVVKRRSQITRIDYCAGWMYNHARKLPGLPASLDCIYRPTYYIPRTCCIYNIVGLWIQSPPTSKRSRFQCKHCNIERRTQIGVSHTVYSEVSMPGKLLGRSTSVGPSFQFIYETAAAVIINVYSCFGSPNQEEVERAGALITIMPEKLGLKLRSQKK